jgi:hypothetical protein
VSSSNSEEVREEYRRAVLVDHGATEDVIEELLQFNRCRVDLGLEVPEFPLDEEPHLAAWRRYADDAEREGVWQALRPRFPQLQFPIRTEISAAAEYRAATLRGEFPAADAGHGLELRRPERLELRIHPSIAGAVPILSTDHREDFVALVRAFSARNEPIPIPDSMGACLISGFNNWDRIASHRADWESADPSHLEPGAWSEEFRRLRSNKAAYQDRFIILSRGAYSGVTSNELGLGDNDWLERSYRIRREHECTHYFTVRIFGLLQHNVLEELVADFVGTIHGFGRFDSGAALLFLGLEAHPEFRPGGRLANYRGDPPISDPAFEVICRLAHRAVRSLETVANANSGLERDPQRLARLVFELTKLTLEELASEEAGGLFGAPA